MPDFALARRAMVDSQLRPQGVTDTAVLTAIGAVPREDHVPPAAIASAYVDRSIPVPGGVIIPAAVLGRMLTEALPIPGERALVVGAAPDYAAAVLRQIGLDVAQTTGADVLHGPVQGPFDLILIEGAVAALPASLTDALSPGGRIVTAMLTSGAMTRLAIGRNIGGVIGYNRFADSDIPALDGFTPPPAFTF